MVLGASGHRHTEEEFDAKLKPFMQGVYGQLTATADSFGKKDDLMAGANIAAFLKVAQTAMQQGAV